ncbi:MAG: hypothetical protein HUU38_28770 [Anaerolineales bacterium]|nr:hypothetical protein [Anaerolineales bacterium]
MNTKFLRASRIFFWEFLQNFPLICGFTYALALAKQENWLWMFLSGFAGSLLGSLTIRFTEPFIVPGKKEAIKVTMTNVIVFFVVAMLMSIYFAQKWGGWLSDLALGILLGAGVGYTQDLAAGQKKPEARHILALSVAFTPTLFAIRALNEIAPPLYASFVLNLMVTLIIIVIDYLWTGDQPSEKVRKL